jgi:hypothetical protein
MMTKRKKTSVATYRRLSDKQLVTLIRKWQKKFSSLAKAPASRLTQGWTPAQLRAGYARELKVVASVLRIKILKAIDAKIIELKRHEASKAVIKRLQAKRSQVSRAKSHITLATIVAALKLSSFKAPASRIGARRTARKAARKIRRTARKIGRTVRRTSRKTVRKSRRTAAGRKSATKRSFFGKPKKTAISTKYKKQTVSLKKEIKKLKQRNSFMRNQVAKFRKEVAQLERHYGVLSNKKPRLSLVSNKKVGQDVSNIVRFSNALGNAVTGKRGYLGF